MQQAKSAIVQRTADSVARELSLAEELHNLLLREKAILSERNFNDLPSVTETKLALVSRLEMQSEQRFRLLPNAGSQDWDALIEGGDETLKASWNQLKQELELCKEVNRINELVVARSKRATEQVLNLLRGNSAPQDLYTKQGNKISTRGAGAYLNV